MSVDAQRLIAVLPGWCTGMSAAAPELNALDGRLGDADLGVTLDKCAALIGQAVPSLPNSLEGIFKACAQATAKASGSSFGTLFTVALMTAMRQTAGVTSLDRAGLGTLIGETVAAMSSRGGASLGDKTVLDGLQAIHLALVSDRTADGDLKSIAMAAVRDAIEAFRDKPNRIGRARIFADKTIGQDDPGMVALLRMVESL